MSPLGPTYSPEEIIGFTSFPSPPFLDCLRGEKYQCVTKYKILNCPTC